MVELLTPADLEPFTEIDDEKAQAMIADAIAMASQVAPCILTDEFGADPARLAQARAILRGAVLRWNEAGTGAVTQQTAGPFQQTVDNRADRRGMFWPTEIAALKELCPAVSGAAFQLNTTPTSLVIAHADICALHFGATYCSCGAILAGRPLWETDTETA